jgi:hypothetical protein
MARQKSAACCSCGKKRSVDASCEWVAVKGVPDDKNCSRTTYINAVFIRIRMCMSCYCKRVEKKTRFRKNSFVAISSIGIILLCLAAIPPDFGRLLEYPYQPQCLAVIGACLAFLGVVMVALGPGIYTTSRTTRQLFEPYANSRFLELQREHGHTKLFTHEQYRKHLGLED